MTALADTKAAMLRHVPEDEKDLRRSVALAKGSGAWQSLARAVVARFPDGPPEQAWARKMVSAFHGGALLPYDAVSYDQQSHGARP